ncbi:MAG TPA: DUF488 family protein [Candidatus Paceibacterota bacterium]|nr:DUF488 family protein [Candidatus Paceibacterota bacterium]
MHIRVKRVYERPAKADGVRILADRLWPRGVTKEKAAIKDWAKELSPSDGLRRWFHESPETRFAGFERKYASELKKNREAIRERMSAYTGTVTLVTSVKDIERSHIPTLVAFLASRSR